MIASQKRLPTDAGPRISLHVTALRIRGPRQTLQFCSILSFVILLTGDWKLDAALGSCLLLGLRHGFDYDHLAAISDITAVQRSWRSGLRRMSPHR